MANSLFFYASLHNVSSYKIFKFHSKMYHLTLIYNNTIPITIFIDGSKEYYIYIVTLDINTSQSVDNQCLASKYFERSGF